MCSSVRPDSRGSAVRVGLRGHGTSRSWGPAGILTPQPGRPMTPAPSPPTDAQLHLCFMSPKIGRTSFPSVSSHFPPRSWIHGGCGGVRAQRQPHPTPWLGKWGDHRLSKARGQLGATQGLCEDRGQASRSIPGGPRDLEAPCYSTVANAPPGPRTRTRFPCL